MHCSRPCKGGSAVPTPAVPAVLTRATVNARLLCLPPCSACNCSWDCLQTSKGPIVKAILPKCSVRRASCLAVATAAWFGAKQPSPQLWNYDGSYVRKLPVEELQLLHRLSFGHRNQRSYLIVLYQQDSPACQAFEQEVERLAAGLRHERAFVAAAVDTSSQAAARFASNMLNVSHLPAVLLYPEAARGCLKFLGPDMSAPGMLAAINKARRAALPPGHNSTGAADWQLLDATIPLGITALRAAAASGGPEALTAAVQEQMVPLQPTPLPVVAQGTTTVWTQYRLALWVGMLLLSLGLLAWDLKIADAWEDWCLARRQAARARGKKFTVQDNMDDMFNLMLSGLQQRIRGAVPKQQQDQRQVTPLQLLQNSVEYQKQQIDLQQQQTGQLSAKQQAWRQSPEGATTESRDWPQAGSDRHQET